MERMELCIRGGQKKPLMTKKNYTGLPTRTQDVVERSRKKKSTTVIFVASG